MESLTTVEIARARHHTYLLLSRLYLEGLTRDLLPFVRAVPALAAATPASPDFELAAASHYRIFGLNLFPYESVFLDPAGLLGGQKSTQVANYYQNYGYQMSGDVAPDHIGHQLGFLAHLCAAEAEALATGYQGAEQSAERQQAFLVAHLSRWLPPFVVATDREGDPFYRALATLSWEMVTEHLHETRASWSLPPQPDLAEDDKITLRNIASTLLSSPLSGYFLSRETISNLGRGQNLPRGFGSRQQTLLNLMRSAAQYDQFSTLLEALQAEAARWSQAYEALLLSGPSLATTVSVWQERVEETEAMLARLGEKANALS